LSRQKIDLFPISYPSTINADDLSDRPASRDGNLDQEEPGEDNTHSRFYRLKFSPCGQYLAVAKRNKDLNIHSEGSWSITIWKREKARIRSKETFLWQVLAEVSSIYGDLLPEGTFAFNARYLLLAIMEIRQTVLWNFGKAAPGALSSTLQTVFY
jgi:hypothetical protein